MIEMQNEARIVVVERELPHPVEKVWRAITQQHLLEDWLMKNNFVPVVGQCFELSFEWGAVTGQVLKVEPNKALSYTWVSGELDTVVAWTLTPTGIGTLLRMEQIGFRAEHPRYFSGAKAGWPRFFAALEQLLDRVD